MYACTQFGNPVMAEAADIAVNVSVLYSCLNIVLQHIRSVFWFKFVFRFICNVM